MEIICMKLSEITPYERNPGNNETAVETVAGLLAINLRSGIVRLDADERGVCLINTPPANRK
jgi:hypothetical protein